MGMINAREAAERSRTSAEGSRADRRDLEGTNCDARSWPPAVSRQNSAAWELSPPAIAARGMPARKWAWAEELLSARLVDGVGRVTGRARLRLPLRPCRVQPRQDTLSRSAGSVSIPGRRSLATSSLTSPPCGDGQRFGVIATTGQGSLSASHRYAPLASRRGMSSTEVDTARFASARLPPGTARPRGAAITDPTDGKEEPRERA